MPENVTGTDALLKSLDAFRKTFIKITSRQKAGGLRHSEFFMLVALSKCCRRMMEKQGIQDEADFPGVQISCFSREINNSRSNVTQVINVLENAGYVERIRTAKDRRAVYIRVTDAGRALIRDASWPIRDLLVRTAETMGEEKVAQFVALISEFNTTACDLLEMSDSDR